MPDTNRTLYEIEVALAKSSFFDFRKNIVAFNVNGWSGKLPIFHECDVLVCTKSGYLTEIEIKRSWSDFIADFKKKHKHEDKGLIKHFYYCIPYALKDKVKEFLWKQNCGAGIVTYAEDLFISIERIGETRRCNKLTTEQMLEIARLGAMRVIQLKEKINKLTNNK